MKTILLTGASTGFGHSLAEEALSRGHQVALAVRDLSKVADFTERYPEQTRAIRFDLTIKEDAERAISETIARFGSLDILINNAGYGLLAPLEGTTDEQLECNLTTNFTGPLRLIRAALPIFRTQQCGHIVNLSAIAAYANHAGFSVYGGAKAALDAACEAVAEECAPFGIHFTAVIPGPFRTDFIARSLDTEQATTVSEYAPTVGKFASILQRMNGRQPGDPDKAAKAICDLLELEKPPARLLLGAYAYDRFGKKLATLDAEMNATKELGWPTDFTG